MKNAFSLRVRPAVTSSIWVRVNRGRCANSKARHSLLCCNHACIPRHSVGYSLGFEGETEKLPNSQVLMLSTMCGHGMISHSLARKMIDFVKEGRRTPKEAASVLTRFCSCGVFNPVRAARIIEDARTKTT